MKKVRADAAENKLPTQAREELATLVTNNAPLATLRDFFKRHGIDLSLQGASRAHHRLTAAQQRLATRAATIRELRSVAQKHGVTLTEAALDTAANAVGDLLDAQIAPDTEEGQQLLLKALTGLTGARSVEVSAERVTVAKGSLAVAQRKLKLLEEKEAKAKAVVNDAQLSSAEQAARLREIFAK